MDKKDLINFIYDSITQNFEGIPQTDKTNISFIYIDGEKIKMEYDNGETAIINIIMQKEK